MSDPTSIAVDSKRGDVYVINAKAKTVSMIDEATNTVTAIIPVGSSPSGVAVDPNSGVVYVANTGDGTLSVIDEVTSQVTATISLGAYPLSVGVDPNTGRVYAGDTNGVPNFDGSVSVVDEATNKVTATIPLGPNYQAYALGVDPKIGTVYVANGLGTHTATGDNVSVIREATNKVIATVPVGHRPQSVGVDPIAGLVYAGNYPDGTVSVINALTNKVTDTFRVAPGASLLLSVGLDQDSGTVYLLGVGHQYELTAVAETTDRVTARVPVTSGSSDLGVDPTTGVVYVSNTDNNTVSVVTTDPPTVTGVSPNTGPVTGGTNVTITGTGFLPGATVMIGQGHGAGPTTIPATEVNVVSATQLTATTGGNAVSGRFHVFVTDRGGSSQPHLYDLFTYEAASG